MSIPPELNSLWPPRLPNIGIRSGKRERSPSFKVRSERTNPDRPALTGWPVANQRRHRCWERTAPCVGKSELSAYVASKAFVSKRKCWRPSAADALTLAKLHRAGELTSVWVPDPGHEAVRELVRAREAAMEDLWRTRQHLHPSYCATAGSLPVALPGPRRIQDGCASRPSTIQPSISFWQIPPSDRGRRDPP